MVVWTNDMETGVSGIDADHKHLIEFYNLANATSRDKFSSNFNDKMLSIIRNLFISHFEKEEDLMFGINYPHTNKHIVEHSAIMSQFDILMQTYEQDRNPTPVIELTTEWIETHQQSDDIILASFIKTLKLENKQKAIEARSASLDAGSKAWLNR